MTNTNKVKDVKLYIVLSIEILKKVIVNINPRRR